MKKKVDSRVKTLIENGVKARHRSFFVVVGDHGRDQVVNLHYMLSKARVKARPSVLWCYKKELGFSSHKRKRMKQIKKKIARGTLDATKDDPFELFISSTQIRYCYYKETHKILGTTFGMLVLQDFEAITPNILARTIETVEGGGLVVLLLRTMRSLKQLYTLSMDVHSRFRTEAHQNVVARFNERFLLSLGHCKSCLVVDDELNILPLSSHARALKKIVLPPGADGEETSVDSYMTADERELQAMKLREREHNVDAALVKVARTVDQAKAVLTFASVIRGKALSSTVALTAARGRGKSAALGLAMAGAVAYGYSNIFVTSPSPENLKTLFSFVFSAFDELGYREHEHYEIVQSTNPALNKAIVRVNIHRPHRQTIQYFHPTDHKVLSQAELVVIDEAAAIPLPVVKQLLGPYLVFLSSTINGYEGTGRSLSLKLFEQLREQARKAGPSSSGLRSFEEIKLEEPIRYASGDATEAWLNKLLCLDAVNVDKVAAGCPHPSACDLYYVNRDTLFSYHKASESFLHRMMSLYVASHYKNTPNDLQLMSDAPAHNLFVLLGPVDEGSSDMPDILCVVQVCLEGELSSGNVQRSLARGERASGDLIPWTVSMQFQDTDFPSLSGGRVVRIAVHPAMQRMGYGQRALELLARYYEGSFVALDDDDEDDGEKKKKQKVAEGIVDDGTPLLAEKLKPRLDLPPLLLKLSERPAERLHYLGTSFGMTSGLYKFWNKAGYMPVYVRQTKNELTGEHSCVMLKKLAADDLPTTCAAGWLEQYHSDFKRRFTTLLGYAFRPAPIETALTVLNPKLQRAEAALDGEAAREARAAALQAFTPYDVKRLQSYANNMVDFHMIMDLVPALARLFFVHDVPLSLSAAQAGVLVGMGLQYKELDDIVAELNIRSGHVLAFFNKTVRRINKFVRDVFESEAAKELPPMPRPAAVVEHDTEALADELEESGRKTMESLAAQQLGNLSAYAIGGDDAQWEAALKERSNATDGTVSLRSTGDKRKERVKELNARGNSTPKSAGKKKKKATSGKKRRR